MKTLSITFKDKDGNKQEVIIPEGAPRKEDVVLELQRLGYVSEEHEELVESVEEKKKKIEKKEMELVEAVENARVQKEAVAITDSNPETVDGATPLPSKQQEDKHEMEEDEADEEKEDQETGDKQQESTSEQQKDKVEKNVEQQHNDREGVKEAA
eukprot:CAMPEP_0184497090 /NCGR_PEP_ID=MMETSP0113_2-20130426/35651_1 /TAXON_ID=91329 /ORGANISM="Norrisiella sphaerica, Strain BC52" /LENGTH=154 /DNA_ID=CAMNT_0026884047 /DNA_START=273 /DNA_END=737 /DNA_ORIENTATION=-